MPGHGRCPNDATQATNPNDESTALYSPFRLVLSTSVFRFGVQVRVSGSPSGSRSGSLLEMSRLALVTFAATLAACASAPAKQVATTPSPVAAPCPTIVVDGVVQPSRCAASKKTEPAKCDGKAPLYVVDGVVVGCGTPEGD